MSREAQKNKPIKPPGAYFTFRNERLKSMPTTTTNRSAKIYLEWTDLPQEEKAKYEKEFLEKMKEYGEKYKAWEKQYANVIKVKTERAKTKEGAEETEEEKRENQIQQQEAKTVEWKSRLRRKSNPKAKANPKPETTA